VGIALDESAPDHSTISRTRRLVDLETHREVFAWILGLLADAGLVKGKRIGIDATTLEANAALRSIVRRDNGETYEEFLKGLAQQSGIATPTREDLARVDRKRKKKGSNEDWVNPHDRDARITKMKDGCTHLAHKAEHAVDMDTGAVVAVTLQEANLGDTTTVKKTLAEAGTTVADLIEREAEATPLEAPKVNLGGIEELVADKGYHSGPVLEEMKAVGVRTYIPEKKQTGKRHWVGKAGEQKAVYANRQRLQRPKGQRTAAQARGVDRTDLRTLLRDGRHAADASEKTQQHSEAAADPRRRSESGIAAEDPVRKRHTEEPARALVDTTVPFRVARAGTGFKHSEVRRVAE
jgi:hypothetical protein